MIAGGSPFGPEQLAGWRQLLVGAARRLGADLDGLDAGTDGEHGSAQISHPADVASDLQDQDLVGAEAVEAAANLRLVQRAIDKIDTGRPVPFGLCELTGTPIEHERLRLMPWTPFCSAASEKIEREGLTLEGALLPV